jgi:arginine exporter protein ArgO
MFESIASGVAAGYAIAIPVGAIAVLILETDRFLFVLGAFAASWSRQTFLAAVGALAQKHMSAAFRNITSLLGNFMIIGLGIKILI